MPDDRERYGLSQSSAYVTRLERRREQRLRRNRTYLRWARVCGVITGLSVMTIILAHTTPGTHAFLDSQASSQVGIGAAAHFPAYDEGIENQVSHYSTLSMNAVQQASDILKQIDACQSSAKATTLLAQMDKAIQTAQLQYAAASNYKSQLDAVATEDEQSYQVAKASSAQLDGTVKPMESASPSASYSRVAEWSASADASATNTLTQTGKAVQPLADLDAKAKAAIQLLIAKEATAKAKDAGGKDDDTQTGSSAGSSNGATPESTTGAVYGVVEKLHATGNQGGVGQ